MADTDNDTTLVTDGELLCYCTQTGRGDFMAFAAAKPDMNFEGACEATGVGMLCTSCLLNAELAFTQARETGAAHVADAKPGARSQRKWGLPRRRDIVDLAIQHSPRVPAPFESRCPILSGPDVRTVLSVSNAVPAPIGPRSARFRVRASVRAANGEQVRMLEATIQPGERCDFDLSEALGAPPSNTLTAGSAIVSLLARDRGFKGTVRPHFRIVTPTASSAVHTSNAGARATTPHIYSQRKSGEHRYIYIQNAEKREAECIIALTPLAGGQAETFTRSLAPLGSALVELPPVGDGFIEAHARSATLQRSYFILADADLRRISVDHI